MKKYLLLFLTLLLSSCTVNPEPIQNESQDDHIFIEENFDFPLFHEEIIQSEKMSFTIVYDDDPEIYLTGNYKEEDYQLYYSRQAGYERDKYTITISKDWKEGEDYVFEMLFFKELTIIQDNGVLSHYISYGNVEEHKEIISSMNRKDAHPLNCQTIASIDSPPCNDEDEQLIMQQQEELSSQLKKMLIELDIDDLGINFYK